MAAKTGTHTRKRAETDNAALLFQNSANLDAAGKAGEALFNGMVEVSQELTAFANKRLKENLDCCGKLMACKQPEDAFRLQWQQAETAAAHYLEETRRLLDIAARVSRASWGPLRERTEETLKELNGDK